MLRIVGDINLADGYFDTGIGTGSSIKQGMNPFTHLQRTSDDYWIGNMECVCAETSNQQGLKASQFRISPQYLDGFKHLDCYGVANNHVMQHGHEAYQSMLTYLEQNGVAYAGAAAKKTHVFEHQGKRVAFTAFCQRPDNFTQSPLYWSLPEYEEIKAELNAHKDCDYRIVFVHWGNEFINYPYIDQKQFAHELIDSGANLVIGMHSHVMQGCENYKGQWIFYSLGNFVFNMPWTPAEFGLIVNVDLVDEPRVSYDYIHIGKDFSPIIIHEVPRDFQMETLNNLLDVNEENEKYYAHVRQCNKRYRKTNRKAIIMNFLHMKPTDSLGIIAEFIKKRI
ncbi:MAG: CapA family protein [Prevotella sp.]|nr:CapA family protein [Prevotella sp.]